MTTTTHPAVYSTAEAGQYLGIEASVVRRYCISGRLKATKVGRDWVVLRADLDRFARKPRQVGRPPQ